MRFIVFILSIFSTITLFSQNYTWPIKGNYIGQDILYQPQDFINEELNFSTLFIGAKENSLVISPCNGEIISVNHLVFNTLDKISGIPIPVNNNEDLKKLFEQCKGVCLSPDTEVKYISTMVTISVGKREKIRIWGLKLREGLKTGYILKKGEIIGHSSYAYKAIKQPCIGFSREIASIPSDPMSIFGLRSTFISPKENKIDYITYKHSVQKLKQDFTIFRESLEEGHPGLYDYTSKSEMDKLFDEVYKSIRYPMTTEEFKMIIIPIIKSIRDSHTAIISKKYKIANNSNLPILYGVKSDSVIIYSTLPEYKKFLNKEIIKIDDDSISTIIPRVKKMIYGNDGYIESCDKRLLLLYFWKYYQRLTRKRNGDEVKIQFADNSKMTFSYSVYNIEDFFPKIRKEEDERFLIKNLSTNIGLIKLNTFDLLNSDIDTISNFVTKPTLEHLIIDVRNNLGGDIKIIEEIFSLVAQKPFKITLSEMVNKKDSYKLFKNSINHSYESCLFENYKEIKNKKGYYLTENNFPFIEPNKNLHFDKNLYILINEFSKSASAIFPALVYKYNLGKIIGRETGSTFCQLNATTFAQVYLKNTGIELHIPLVKSIFSKKDKNDILWGRGVIPDYVVEIDFNEFIGNNDPILDTALDIIRKQDELKSKKIFYFIIISVVSILIFFLILRYLRKVML
ncbi:MAG: S41 family peptidase [Bacteroidales bacterium]|nr:S41 family peptidase [Bacteroidales bacterium]